MSRAASLGALGVLLGLAGGALAAEPLPLSLRGAVLLALERSPEVRVERLAAAAAATGVDEARAAFDPALSASASHGESEHETTARQSALETAAANERRSRTDEASVELSKPFSTGTRVAVSADGSRSRANVAPEEFGARVAVQVTQPLLRGVRPAANLARVGLAENRARIGRHALVAALQDLVAGVETAYWGLALAGRAVAVRAASLDAARALLRDPAALVEAGRRPRVELAGARAEAAAGEEALADAHTALEAARLELLRRLGPGRGLSWDLTPLPLDEPGLPDLPEAVAEAVAGALTPRPDLLQARLELANGELQVVETRDGLLPRLELFASYAQSGLGVTLREAWDSALGAGREDWRVGLRLETPLGLRAEGARARRAEFDRDRAGAAVENLAHRVEAQVRSGFTEVAGLARKVELSAATAEARRQEAEAELARFDAGRATASEVLRAEARRAEAELAHHRVRSDARKAWAEWLRLQGRLLEAWGVEVF
ncbi:MAG: TolC family protein [Deferrisomatales bacterium]